MAEFDEAVVPHTVWKIMAEWRKEAEELDLKVKQSQALSTNGDEWKG